MRTQAAHRQLSIAATLVMSIVARAAVAQDPWRPPVPIGPVALGMHPFEYITPDGTRDTADVGAFRVPNRYDGSSRDSLTLVFVRLRSRAVRPASPLVYLSGGPGTSAIELAGFQQMRFMEDMRAAGDVILLDQRGTGRSEPHAMCPGRWDLSADLALDDPKLLRRVTEQVKRCADSLRSHGIDLTTLTTPHVADDVETLRRALRVPRVNLFGFSSGSHFALEVARRHPSSVDRIVIGGVEGAGQTYKLPANAAPMLERLDAVVRANPPFGGHIPNLLALADTVHRRLREKPAVARLPIHSVLRANSRPWWQRAGISVLALFTPHYAVTIHEVDLQALLAIGLGRMDVLSELPSLYRAMADGEYNRAGLLLLGLRKAQPIGNAMGWIVDCADGASASRADSIARQTGSTIVGPMTNFPFPKVCEAFGPIPDVGDAEREPVRSSIPVLMAAGTLDGRTPLEQAREVLRWLPNGALITVDNAAHGDVTIFNAPEIRAAVMRFLRAEPVGITQLALPAPTFVAMAKPRASLADTLVAAVTKRGASALLRRYDELRSATDARYEFAEAALNIVGYRLLQTGAVDAALAAFRRNVELYPRSLNVYDSLGEGLIAAKRWSDAAACLSVAISLGYNPHSYRLMWTLPPLAERGGTATESVCLSLPWRAGS